MLLLVYFLSGKNKLQFIGCIFNMTFLLCLVKIGKDTTSSGQFYMLHLTVCTELRYNILDMFENNIHLFYHKHRFYTHFVLLYILFCCINYIHKASTL